VMRCLGMESMFFPECLMISSIFGVWGRGEMKCERRAFRCVFPADKNGMDHGRIPWPFPFPGADWRQVADGHQAP